MKAELDIIHEYEGLKRSTKNLDQLHRELFDRQSEYHKKLGIVPCILPNVSSIAIGDDDYMDKIGISKPWDLITNNFGVWLQMQLSDFGRTFSMVDEAGVTQTYVNKSGTSNIWAKFNSTPAVRLGSSATVVARTDFNVTTPFVGAPEANKAATTLAGFGSNKITITGLIGPFGAAQTIREGCWFNHGWRSNGINNDYTAFLRYNYTDTAVSIGQTPAVTIEIAI